MKKTTTTTTTTHQSRRLENSRCHLYCTKTHFAPLQGRFSSSKSTRATVVIFQSKEKKKEKKVVQPARLVCVFFLINQTNVLIVHAVQQRSTVVAAVVIKYLHFTTPIDNIIRKVRPVPPLADLKQPCGPLASLALSTACPLHDLTRGHISRLLTLGGKMELLHENPNTTQPHQAFSGLKRLSDTGKTSRG